MNTASPDTAYKPKSTIEAILMAVERFKAINPGKTDESIGYHAVKDASIIERLRNGGDCTTRKCDALIRYMSKPTKRK